MSSYTPIRTELRQIDQMILQAHAHHLIAAIHHDLVRRKAILFAKAAHLDADSLLLWKKDASFFHNVMHQIDLFNVGEIDEKTLYKRIPNIKKYTEKAASAAAAAVASAAAISAATAISAAVVASAARTNAEADSLATKLARISNSPSVLPPSANSNAALWEKNTTSQDIAPQPVRHAERKRAPLKEQPEQAPDSSPILAPVPEPSPAAPAISTLALAAPSVSPEPMPLKTGQIPAAVASDECDDEGVTAPPSSTPAAKVKKAQRGMQKVPKSAQAETINKAGLNERPQKRKIKSAQGVKKGKKGGQNTMVERDDDDEPPAPKQKKRKRTGEQDHDEEWRPAVQPKKGKKVATEEDSGPEDDELDSTSGEEKKTSASRRAPRCNLEGTKQFFADPCSLCLSRKIPCEKPNKGGSCVGCKVWKMKCMHAWYHRNTPKKLKTAQKKHNTKDSDRVEVSDEELEPASAAAQPTASTSQLGSSSTGSATVETTNLDPTEARLQRIEAGYANIERMLLVLSQNKPLP